jgi:hypothetical protein
VADGAAAFRRGIAMLYERETGAAACMRIRGEYQRMHMGMLYWRVHEGKKM